MSEMPPTNEDCRPVPGYDGDYVVCRSGAVWSCKGGAWSRKATWTEHGHETVELWRNGYRTRRRVSTIQQEVFGTGPRSPVSDHELAGYLRRVYELDDHEVAAILNGASP